MAFEIQFTVSNSGGVAHRKYTLMTENKSFINSVINVGNNNTITLSDMDKLERAKRVAGDFGVLEECDIAGRNALQNKIKNKDANYEESGLWSAISNFDVSCLKNDYIYVNVPNGTTMADVKSMFKLPDGALKDYLKAAYDKTPGNRDTYTVTSGKVWFKAEDFAVGNGMNIDELKAMFANK